METTNSIIEPIVLSVCVVATLLVAVAAFTFGTVRLLSRRFRRRLDAEFERSAAPIAAVTTPASIGCVVSPKAMEAAARSVATTTTSAEDGSCSKLPPPPSYDVVAHWVAAHHQSNGVVDEEGEQFTESTRPPAYPTLHVI